MVIGAAILIILIVIVGAGILFLKSSNGGGTAPVQKSTNNSTSTTVQGVASNSTTTVQSIVNPNVSILDNSRVTQSQAASLFGVSFGYNATSKVNTTYELTNGLKANGLDYGAKLDSENISFANGVLVSVDRGTQVGSSLTNESIVAAEVLLLTKRSQSDYNRYLYLFNSSSNESEYSHYSTNSNGAVCSLYSESNVSNGGEYSLVCWKGYEFVIFPASLINYPGDNVSALNQTALINTVTADMQTAQ